MDTASFLLSWHEAALTSLSFFWKALWAFVFGYVVSSCIQVFVTRERMRRVMGEDDASSVALATLFGFLSSSCSFAALATTKSLFRKGAGFVSSLAFLLASTNLVIELGFVIAVFLSWQFVLGEYLGGLLLILFMWLFVRLFAPWGLVREVRERLGGGQGAGGSGHAAAHGDSGREGHSGEEHGPPPRPGVFSRAGWQRVARTYFMEWGMVWKDVTIGFTAAGIIAVFVPASFFQALFLSGESGSLWAPIQNVLVGPVAAFFTFIGSMGNIPLAAVLYGSGVSFAGVMAFIFSDLVVFPVIRIHARYYGWRMALLIAAIFLAALACSALVLHWTFGAAGLLPPSGVAVAASRADAARFPLDYGFVLNLVFLAVSMGLAWLARQNAAGHDHGGHGGHAGHEHGGQKGEAMERALLVAALLAYGWLAGGLLAGLAA
ncbi:permease [Paucidesulfovibrio longus]|uniref:permease n=1 Tax=Paucidesulfovibrio longus TaxID=889 RepID=UPI000400315F|nr:permease [Paucidesulfovibrio longus]